MYKNFIALVLIIFFAIFGYLYIPEIAKKSQKQKTPPQEPVKKQIIEDDLKDYNTYKFKYTYNVNVSGLIYRLFVMIFIPRDIPYHQYVTINSISLTPSKSTESDYSLLDEFVFDNISQNKILTIEGTVKTKTYDLERAKKINQNISPEQDLSRYLQPEELIESNDPYIKDIAQKITGNTKEEIIQNIYVYIQKNMKYVNSIEDLGAKKALKLKRGKCTDYAAAMAALCRAKNIPSRIVSGNTLEKGKNEHSWVEIYFDEYGWVTFDPAFMGVLVKKYSADGKVHQYMTYDCRKTYFDYLILSKNLIRYQIMNYIKDPNPKNDAYVVKHFTFEKIKNSN